MDTTFNRAMKLAALLAAAFLVQQAAHADTVKLPLQKFTSASALEMRCQSGGQNIAIPIPERWKVTKAMLSLRYTVSNNMLPDMSQMVLKVNGELVTQMKLDNM